MLSQLGTRNVGCNRGTFLTTEGREGQHCMPGVWFISTKADISLCLSCWVPELVLHILDAFTYRVEPNTSEWRDAGRPAPCARRLAAAASQKAPCQGQRRSRGWSRAAALSRTGSAWRLQSASPAPQCSRRSPACSTIAACRGCCRWCCSAQLSTSAAAPAAEHAWTKILRNQNCRGLYIVLQCSDSVLRDPLHAGCRGDAVVFSVPLSRQICRKRNQDTKCRKVWCSWRAKTLTSIQMPSPPFRCLASEIQFAVVFLCREGVFTSFRSALAVSMAGL